MVSAEKTENILRAIDEKFPGFRSNKRWSCPVFAYDSVDEFSRDAMAKNGMHTIYDGGLPIDLHLSVDSGKPLVIFLNARSSERTDSYRLPSFVGFGVVPAAGVSVLRINDPVLYTSRTLRIGWYAGAAGNPLLYSICQIINKVVDITEPKKIIFVGGSAGGFACLNFSRFFKDSLAVVWNPQTDLLKFSKEEVLEFTSSAFGLTDFEACERILPALTASSMHKHYVGNVMKNYLLYMQNIDDWHVREHCKPFLKDTGRVAEDRLETKRFDERFFLYAADWGKGHASPPQSFLKSLLKNIVSDEVKFSNLFSDGRIDEILSRAEIEV